MGLAKIVILIGTGYLSLFAAADSSYTLPGVLVMAIVTVFGLFTRQNAQARDDMLKREAIERARADAERERTEKLVREILEPLVKSIERLDDNIDAVAAIIEGQVRRVTGLHGTDDEPAPAPSSPPEPRPQGRRRRIVDGMNR